MAEVERVDRLLAELERVVDYLERMNLRGQTDVPAEVTEILLAAGLTDTGNLEPSVVLPRILDRQQALRRRLAAMRRV